MREENKNKVRQKNQLKATPTLRVSLPLPSFHKLVLYIGHSRCHCRTVCPYPIYLELCVSVHEQNSTQARDTYNSTGTGQAQVPYYHYIRFAFALLSSLFDSFTSYHLFFPSLLISFCFFFFFWTGLSIQWPSSSLAFLKLFNSTLSTANQSGTAQGQCYRCTVLLGHTSERARTRTSNTEKRTFCQWTLAY